MTTFPANAISGRRPAACGGPRRVQGPRRAAGCPLPALVAVLIVLISGSRAPAQTAGGSADSLQKKVDYLIANGEREKPDPRPTVLTDPEVDAYMNSGRLKIPDGISDIHLVTTVGEATATAKIDFDKLLAKERKMNPLWSLFSGVHDVKVLTRAWGKDGMGNVQVLKVWFDGREIPRYLLEFFVDRYLKPKVPQASLDSRFKMPARIWTATVTRGKTTLVQR